MLVTLFEMETDVRELQWQNALSPMVVTLLVMLNSPAFFPGQATKVLLSLEYRTPSTVL